MTPFQIVEKLQSKGYEAFYVGGYVRDMVLGMKPGDIDITTNAKPDDIIKIFEGEKLNLVGKSFGVVIVNGTEIATYRKDRYFGEDFKNLKVSYSSNVEEDVSRRDLTINGLLFDPLKGEILDFTNGMDDLKDGILRFIGDPEERLKEDPNRMLRIARFNAYLYNKDFYIPYETIEVMIENNDLFFHVAPERIRLEILKTMKSKYASVFFETLSEVLILEEVFPSMYNSIDVKQNHFHKETVYHHLMMCGDAISCKYPLLKLAGYLHDIGKPYVKSLSDDKKNYEFIKHDMIGAEVIRKELKELRFSNDEIDYISNIIDLHMSVPFLTEKSIRKAMRKLKEKNIPICDMMRFKIADRRAKISDSGKIIPFSISEIKAMVSKVEAILLKQEPFSIRNMKVNGYDVMKELNIQPGPKVGEVLNYLFEIVLEDPSLNNEEDLLSIMRRRSE